jgi:DnaJ-class molecular chaperone
MPDDDRPTPIPDERPTQPEMEPLYRPCPACGGQGRMLVSTSFCSTMQQCDLCKGERRVTGRVYAAWHSGRRSKP